MSAVALTNRLRWRGKGSFALQWRTDAVAYGLPSLPIAALILTLALANGFYLIGSAVAFSHSALWPDWSTFAQAAHDVVAGANPYEGTVFRWSPVAAWILVPLTSAGPLTWLAGLLAVPALIPERRLRWLVWVSWPFWYDVFSGNMMTVVAVAALLAMRGSRVATWTFLGLALVVPRPLMLPVLLWLLWQRPELRIPFALLFAANVALIALSGWGPAFLAKLTTSTDDFLALTNLSPSRWIGMWWVPIGAALGGLLTLRGRLGWASLAVSPYLIPNYVLIGLLDLAGRPAERPPAFDAGFVAA